LSGYRSGLFRKHWSPKMTPLWCAGRWGPRAAGNPTARWGVAKW